MRWLVAGHGTVGSALVRRIRRRGFSPAVFDPSPRLPVVEAEHLTELDPSMRSFDCVVSCVVPSEAVEVLARVRPVLAKTTLYFDWNTLTPQVKRNIASGAQCSVLDVALMDTLDDEAEEPSLAISGEEAAAAASPLRSLGFRVDVVGDKCGDAALLKLTRSLFMKSLEALVVEFEATIAPLAGRDIVVESIERNLGARFSSFANMLLATNRIHAGRRCLELQGAVEAYRAERSLGVASAAIDVLRAAAKVWQAPDAPRPGTDGRELAHFLSQRLGDADQNSALSLTSYASAPRS